MVMLYTVLFQYSKQFEWNTVCPALRIQFCTKKPHINNNKMGKK